MTGADPDRLCFFTGAMVSGSLIDGRSQKKQRPLFAAPLFLTVFVLAAVGVAGLLGAWGPFSGTVDGLRDLVFVSVLSFAMGVQNAAVASATGLLVRTTHMTGPATDLGVQLATAFHASGDTRKLAFKHALLRFTKITSFTVGAALGVPLAMLMKYGAFLVPAGFVLVATLMSFVKRESVATVTAITGRAETLRDAA